MHDQYNLENYSLFILVRISPAILRQSVYGSLKFGAYYALKRLIPQEQIYSNVACAVVAGNQHICYFSLISVHFFYRIYFCIQYKIIFGVF